MDTTSVAGSYALAEGTETGTSPSIVGSIDRRGLGAGAIG